MRQASGLSAVTAAGGHPMARIATLPLFRQGIGAALKPRLFAYIVATWLVLVILNLLGIPGYYDVALRDLGLALGLAAQLMSGRSAPLSNAAI